MLQETAVTTFHDYFFELLERLPTLSPEFSLQYFEQEWSGRKSVGLIVIAGELGINANMAVEAFHRAVTCILLSKYNHLRGE